MKKYIVALITLCVLLVTGFWEYKCSDTVRIRKHLELGQKYLSEQDYEEAVVVFNEVIEIEPMNMDAYWGLAEAYEGLGDMETAVAILETGYELTNDERIEKRIKELKKSNDGVESEVGWELKESNSIVGRKDIEDTIDLLLDTGRWWLNYLTYTQRENIFGAFVEPLENYLKNTEMDAEAWEALAYAYLYLDDMETCLEIRQKGYEATGDERLIPEEHTLAFANANIFYDEYGRRLEAEYYDEAGEHIHTDIYTYEKGNRILINERIEGQHIWKWEFEYDVLGRPIKRTTIESDYEDLGDYAVYEYESDNVVIEKFNPTKNDWYIYRITYDEYGKLLDEIIVDSYTRH